MTNTTMPYLAHASTELLLHLAEALSSDSGAYANYEENGDREELVESLQALAVGTGIIDCNLRQEIIRYFYRIHHVGYQEKKAYIYRKGVLKLTHVLMQKLPGEKVEPLEISVEYDGKETKITSNCVEHLGKEDGPFYQEHYAYEQGWTKNETRFYRLNVMYDFFQQSYTIEVVDYSEEEKGRYHINLTINDKEFDVMVGENGMFFVKMEKYLVICDDLTQQIKACLEKHPRTRLLLLYT